MTARHRTLIGAIVAACAVLAATAPARPPGVIASDVPLADLLELIVDGRELLAIDARSGGQLATTLELEEAVLWTGSRGAVGIVLTDRRAFAVSSKSGTWQEARYLRNEELDSDVLLGDRVALLATNRRVLGFEAGSGNLIESRLGVREKVLAQRVGENSGVVVTDRRALGLSPARGGFFEIGINAQERIEAVEAKANLATVTTDSRILIFRVGTASWEERLRGPR